MIRIFVLTSAIALTASALGAAPEQSEPKTVTWTGWFSDKDCASPRAAKGDFQPNNPDCVKRCLDKGITPVFFSEQAKALFDVTNYPSVRADVGYHLELTGTVDDTRKAISVKSVKRLWHVGAMCALPKKSGK